MGTLLRKENVHYDQAQGVLILGKVAGRDHNPDESVSKEMFIGYCQDSPKQLFDAVLRMQKRLTNRIEEHRRQATASLEDDREEEYEVESILGSRIRGGKLQYQIKWINYDYDPHWYNASNCKHAAQRLQDFHYQYPDQAGPPKNLDYWLECDQEDKTPRDRHDDNECVI